MRTTSVIFACLFILGFAPVHAQSVSVSVGPQLSLVGIGGSVSVKFMDQVSASADFGFVPIGDINFDADDIEYSLEPSVAGGLIGVNFHPMGSNLSIGAGIFLGGYSGDATSESLIDTIEIGDGEYDASEVGSLVGSFDWDGPAPAFMLGLRGKGFNVGLGLAFTGAPDFNVEATGPIRNDPTFQRSLDIEIEDAREDVEVVKVLPLFRIGYEFGVR